MLEAIITGIVQGVAEWLPVSSEGMIALLATNLFGAVELETIVEQALFLHLGTLLAAVVYFRRDVWRLLKTLLQYRKGDREDKALLQFLIIATIISGIVGLILLKLATLAFTDFALTGQAITLLVGLMLLVTAVLQLKARKGGLRTLSSLTLSDTILLGVVQGFAALPGLSRSGLTVAALLLRKFDDQSALRLSFLLSIPIVLAGNVFLNFNSSVLTLSHLVSLLFAFAFGLLTIDILIKVARRINFGYFVLLFALLTLGAVFI